MLAVACCCHKKDQANKIPRKNETLALIFIVAYYAAKEELFTGNAAYIFEAIMSFLACIMVTFVGAMMIKLAQLKEKFEEKLGEQVDIADELSSPDSARICLASNRSLWNYACDEQSPSDPFPPQSNAADSSRD